MPLFNVACQECREESEVLIRGAEAAACPACGSTQVEKLLSHFAPMGASTPEAAGCGASQCCMMQGGCQN